MRIGGGPSFPEHPTCYQFFYNYDSKEYLRKDLEEGNAVSLQVLQRVLPKLEV